MNTHVFVKEVPAVYVIVLQVYIPLSFFRNLLKNKYNEQYNYRVKILYFNVWFWLSLNQIFKFRIVITVL